MTSWTRFAFSTVCAALPDRLVGEDDDRELRLLGDVEGVDGRVEAVLDVRRGEDDARHVAVRAEDGEVEVRLLRLRRQARSRGRRAGRRG